MPDQNDYNIPAEHQDLWRQLTEFQFDEPDADYNFTRRLAKRNKWSFEYAQLVLEEYRKFLFLLGAAGHMVTPSIAVDEAWHLHLIYTYSYWELLCVRIFKRPMHHHPGNGKSDNNKIFAAIYERTLVDYQGFFGTPPEEIWGKPNLGLDWRAILSSLPAGKRLRDYVFGLFPPRPHDEAL